MNWYISLTRFLIRFLVQQQFIYLYIVSFGFILFFVETSCAHLFAHSSFDDLHHNWNQYLPLCWTVNIDSLSIFQILFFFFIIIFLVFFLFSFVLFLFGCNRCHVCNASLIVMHSIWSCPLRKKPIQFQAFSYWKQIRLVGWQWIRFCFSSWALLTSH